MSLAITLDLLRRLCPSTPSTTLQQYVNPLNVILGVYEVNTKTRLAMFLAQVAEESGGFKYFIENLNYSADGLLRTFPSHFDASTAAAYARQPERIANRAYANRLGNGNESSGDGWKFRGHGLIQLTGRANVTAFATGLGMSLEDTIAYLSTSEGATMAAAWYWQARKLNDVADTGNVSKITQLINGGQNGEAQREAYYHLALSLL